MLLDCFLYSVLLRCGFEILLVVAGWYVCQGCSRTKQHDQLTKATRGQKTRGQKTRGPGDQAPGNQGPGDQGTRGPRGLGDQETKKTRRPKARGPIEPEDQGTRGPGTAEPLIFFSRNPRFFFRYHPSFAFFASSL